MEENIETCGWFVFYKDQLLIEKKNRKYTKLFTISTYRNSLERIGI